ncbi:Na(+)/H(+) antiporter subunit B [Halalkalibacterium ligniniphilum]|uniref:Na(+)/H(+) antiporter subunit B n=1 Tax=Halalkalibacterium ligniniphilum TaxID=1134413 RepID=UPI000345703E|nr:Na(+)/H(+) antiporter subunit B [Halalkalibacterium ligniniphilum]
MKINDVILQTVTKVAAFVILTFSVYLFLAGHHNPGGGFIGGLVTASAIVLLYLAFDVETVNKIFPIDFKMVALVGVLIAVLTGVGSFLFDAAFLSHTFDYFDLPLFGETELATSVLFDVGVAMAVIGTAVTIILSISEDD